MGTLGSNPSLTASTKKDRSMKLADKLVKVDEDITIRQLDNGFIVEVAGRDSDDEWATVKIVCFDLASVQTLVEEATQLPKNT